MKDLVLQKLAEKLNAPIKGNCPVNKNCIFGYNVKQCSAGRELIEEIFADAKAETIKEAQETGTAKFMGAGVYDGVDWPCSTIIEIEFIDLEKVVKPADTPS